MSRCSFCGTQDVVVTSGHRYCRKHLHLLEEPIIFSWLMDLNTGIKPRDIIQYMHDMFGVEGVKFSDISKLHSQFPYQRKWDYARRCYDYPQKNYVQKCFLDFISNNKLLTNQALIDEIRCKVEADALDTMKDDVWNSE